MPKERTVPATHDCVACKFGGRQKYGEDVCFLTGGKCKKEIESGNVELSIYAEGIKLFWYAIQSQWRVGFSGITGLDYVAAKLIADSLSIDWDEKLLRYLQSMEYTLLKHYSEESKKASEKKKA